jgi:hypothetical protein
MNYDTLILSLMPEHHAGGLSIPIFDNCPNSRKYGLLAQE